MHGLSKSMAIMHLINFSYFDGIIYLAFHITFYIYAHENHSLWKYWKQDFIKVLDKQYVKITLTKSVVLPLNVFRPNLSKPNENHSRIPNEKSPKQHSFTPVFYLLLSSRTGFS